MFKELPGRLQRMALNRVNTGCREQEVCQLRWDWEVKLPELDTCVFVLTSNQEFYARNTWEHIIVLNSIARRVVDERTDKHPEFVFTYKGDHLFNMLTSAWQKARGRANPPGCECMTFVIRLGTGFELRACVLRIVRIYSDKSERITTHYFAPDIARLIESAQNL